jgi:hypothetical protein
MHLTSADVLKQSPLLGFICIMITLGIFVNQFPNSQDQFVTVGKDVNCKNTPTTNQSGDGIVNEYVSTVFVFLLPLFPLLTPPFDKQKLQTAISHLIGQTGSFGSSEVARHFIVSPQATFFDKCNITQQECKTLENTTLLLQSNTSNVSLCSNSNLPFSDIFNSLHGSPHVPSVMFGASMLAFIIAVKYRHPKQDNEEKEKQSVLFIYFFKAILFATCFVIITFIVVDIYLKTSNFPSQIVASIVYGIFLQAMVYGFFKQGKEGNLMLSVKIKEEAEMKNIYNPQ